MGAFGKDLIRHLGGNLQAYNACDNTNITDNIMTDEELKISHQKSWEYWRHQDIYYIRDKITYGQLNINDVTQAHFNNLPKGCYEYFLLWKSKYKQH